MTTQIKGDATSTFGSDIDVTGSIVSDAPMFSVYLSSDQSIPDNAYTKANINTVLIDNKSAYDTSNYKYVVPETGIYQLNLLVILDAVENGTIVTNYTDIYVNGSRRFFSQKIPYSGNSRVETHVFSVIDSLTVNDELEIYVLSNPNDSTDTKLKGTKEYSQFSGYRIG